MKRRALFRIFDRYVGIPIVILLAFFLKRRKRLPIENIQHILFIKLAAIGDSILLIPTLRTLKKRFPDAKITFVCSPINQSILKKIPYIDELISVDIHSYLKHPFRFFDFLKQIRKKKYDVVIDAEQWPRISVMMFALTKYSYSIGFSTEKQYRHFLFNAVVTHTRERHELEDFLALLEPLGINITEEDKKLEYFLNDKDFKFAEEFWLTNDFQNHTVICLHPGCGENGKPREWPVEFYIRLGKRLVEYDKNIVILITGAKFEMERCNEIAAGIGSNVVNTAGQYDIDNVVALVKKVKLIVCSNTGMLHIASCVGTKTLGLHGPTNPVKWGSYNKNSVLIQSDKFCSPCLYLGHDYGCNEPTCMKHISVDDVFIHIRKAIQPELFPAFKILNNQLT
ncbi:MAG: glycosyltransferase family 9 protein [Ignavibacteria bacterium]|nr:glycosyltransferase family 9 protein [Ignavibacteria bacterium]